MLLSLWKEIEIGTIINWKLCFDKMPLDFIDWKSVSITTCSRTHRRVNGSRACMTLCLDRQTNETYVLSRITFGCREI